MPSTHLDSSCWWLFKYVCFRRADPGQAKTYKATFSLFVLKQEDRCDFSAVVPRPRFHVVECVLALKLNQVSISTGSVTIKLG